MKANLPPTAPAASSTRFPKRFFLPRPVAWLVLVLLLAATAGGWFIALKRAEAEARRKFEEEAGRVASGLRERMQIYEDVLHGLAGLYAASMSVERAEWRAYVKSVSVEERFPGIDGLGYIARVPREQAEDFLEAARRDNSPKFTLQVTGTNSELLLIKYLEPEWRHRFELGRDLSLVPATREVADLARDLGRAAVSGLVTLEDDTPTPELGFLMLLPVYRGGLVPPDLATRREKLEGWVFGRFVQNQLMAELMGDRFPSVHFRIRDGSAATTNNLVFDSAPELSRQRPLDAAWFAYRITSVFGNREWVLSFRSTPAFEKTMRRGVSAWVAGVGTLISLLVFGIVWSLSHTRRRALVLAAEMTRTLRATNQRLHLEMVERERVQRRTAAQHAVTKVLSEAETLPEATSRIVQAICEALGWEIGAFWQRNTAEDRLECVEFWHQPGSKAEEFEKDSRARIFRKGVGLPGRVWTTSRPAWIPDVLKDDNFPRAPYAERAGLHAAFGFPVMLNGAMLGVLEFFSREIAEPDEGLLSLMGTAGTQIGQYIERKRGEEALKRSEAIYHSLVESLPLAIVRKDLQGRLTFANSRYCAQLGKPLAELTGRTGAELFPTERAERERQAEQQVLETGSTVETVEAETHSDGDIHYIQTIRTPVYGGSGTVIGLLGIFWDVTDRIRGQEALRQAKEAAEEASRTKSHFLASMSHELRTPLNSVIGFANILLKNKTGTLSATEINFLERIQANGKHLLYLINEILDLSKIEARRVDLQTAPVALDALVRTTLAQQESLIRDKPVELAAEIPPVVAPIITDAEKLRQVLINLLGNAFRFTERGSITVRIVTDPVDDRPVRLDVVDTGIGIARDKLGVIFEAFQQAEAGTARKYGGTGLGLTISQALCQLMGYRITVTSEPGRGSTFSVHLAPEREPEKSPALPPAPEPEAHAKAAGTGELVLVIDDELDSRTLLTHAIEEFGCRTITATSGEDGLRMAREFCPRLITVDLMMPQLDGWQVIAALKADPALRDIPVVVVSIVGSEHRGRILGVVEVLQKPFSRPELLEVLHRCLRQPEPRILIVDDDEDARRVMASHLEDEACEVRQAGHGKEALDLMSTFTPDLVLLDLMMPVMDGMTFLNHLRALPRYQFLPVVVVTAKDLTVAESDELHRLAQEIVKKGETFEHDLHRVFTRLLRHPVPTGKEVPA